LEFDAGVLVFEIEFAAVFVVAIDDANDGLAAVGEAFEELLFDLGELAAFDFVDFALFVVAKLKELVFADEIEGEELVDEGEVVVDAADLEDFFAAQVGGGVPVFALEVIVARFVVEAEGAAVPAIFDIAEEFDADFVGVELGGRAGHGAAVVIAVVDDVSGGEALVDHDGGMPVAGPAFVHNFGLGLRGEVVGFVADDREDVGLPGIERGMLKQEEHDVAFGTLGDFSLGWFVGGGVVFLSGLFAWVDVRVHVVFGGKSGRLLFVGIRFLVGKIVAAGGVSTLDEGGVDIDEVFDAEAGVDEVFDLFDADFVHGAADAAAVVGHFVHHFAIGVGEPVVIFEKIAMAVDVGHDHGLVDAAVAAHEVGVARIVVDDHFVDFLEAVVVAFAELLVLHAETPVGIARREAAAGGDGVELVGVD